MKRTKTHKALLAVSFVLLASCATDNSRTMDTYEFLQPPDDVAKSMEGLRHYLLQEGFVPTGATAEGRLMVEGWQRGERVLEITFRPAGENE